jgi:pimeloyl-ACP methyl ester carboxylesterase
MAYVTSAGVDIYYEVHGSGPKTMMLAHGMGGNAAIWFNQVAHLRDRYKVIAFDHRYFARSGCSVDEFSIDLFADDAISIMDAENITSAVWICQSMGGWTGSQMAVQHPERVEALIMSHTPGVFTDSSAVNDTSRIADIVASGNLPALADDFPDKQPAQALLYQAISSFNNIDNTVIPRKIGEAENGSLAISSLDNYKVPTLFIGGDKDVLFASSFLEALAKALPGAQFKNLGAVGHSSYFELPEAFNTAVDEFLESL